MHDDPPGTLPLLQAMGLKFSRSGVEVLNPLCFDIHPGLTLVRGGDGRGKTTLLRLMAGLLEPTQGLVQCSAETRFYEDLADPVHDAVVASHWLQTRQEQLPMWDTGLATELVHAFGLTDHIDKPLYMLSTGSRRKVGLLAAAAGHASLTLIDMPFAALDTPSRRVLTELLTDAAASQHTAWVIADHKLPASLTPLQLSGKITVIDLGD